MLPDWLPSSFILQSDLTKFGRRDLRLQYRLKAEMMPASRNAKAQFQLFDTKRTVVINRKSGVTAKHFFHEKEIDWKNLTHGNWDFNPIVSLKKSYAKVNISVDRTFYYSGDNINVLTYISNEEGELTCRGIELSLARFISCKGCQKDKRTTEKKFQEITIIYSQREDIELKIGDRNQYSIDLKCPSIDELSFMPKFLTPDEEMVIQSWTPSFYGKAISVRYFVYLRLLFDDLPYEKS